MTWEDLKTFMDIRDTNNDARIQACWNNAGELLTLELTKAFRVMPQGLMDECQLKIGKNLYDGRKTIPANSQFATPDGASFARSSRDPFAEVRAILNLYVVRY